MDLTRELSQNNSVVTVTGPTGPKRFRLESVDVVRGRHHDSDGARSHAGLFRANRVQSHRSYPDYHSFIFHTLDHTFLRAGFLSAYRDGRLSFTTEEIEE